MELLSPEDLFVVVVEAAFCRDGTMAVAEIVLAEAMPGVRTSSIGWSLSGDVFEGDSKGTHDSSSSKEEIPASALAFTTAGDIFFLSLYNILQSISLRASTRLPLFCLIIQPKSSRSKTLMILATSYVP